MSPPIIRFPTTAWLTLATAGLATAAGLVIVLNFFAPRVLPPTFGDILDYLVVFLPLMTAVLLASLRWGQRSLAKDFGFSATWTDLLLGVAAGLLLRVGGMWLEVLFYGIRLTGGGTTLTPRSEGLIWVLVAVLAPIVIAPIIEELFFRGLLLRGLLTWGAQWGAKWSARRGLSGQFSARFSRALAIGLSTVVFVLVHLLGANSAKDALIIAVMTALVGGLAAVMAVRTGRLGPGLALHITYNACVLVPALLA